MDAIMHGILAAERLRKPKKAESKLTKMLTTVSPFWSNNNVHIQIHFKYNVYLNVYLTFPFGPHCCFCLLVLRCVEISWVLLVAAGHIMLLVTSDLYGCTTHITFCVTPHAVRQLKLQNA